MLLLFSLVFFVVADERKVYIVYMGSIPENNYSPVEHHHSILQEILQNSSPSDTLIRSYTRSFNGFVARLTEIERRKLKSMKSVISVFPSRKYQLLTTRSWDFMGLTDDVQRVPKAESDVIVGVIDSGIWPESYSFSDKGFGPPPKKWKGTCNGGKNFTCNNKLIGARYYGGSNARDISGHGTHTASTVAGSLVKDASFYGLAEGNAKGGVPSARIAVYKVCAYKDTSGCSSGDILAAFDDAISDGVDIISVSLGVPIALEYMEDTIAIGSFHAMRKGILTSQAGGNRNIPFDGITSVAPWILTVAASTIDRKFVNKLILGDNTTLVGRAINAFNDTSEIAVVNKVLDGSHPASCDNTVGCVDNQLNSSSGEGKIVFYSDLGDATDALKENAAGMIITGDHNEDFQWIYPLPATLLHTVDGEKVTSYIKKERNPVARIMKSETLHGSTTPVTASFSARGPNPITPDILKPDVTAPGSDIIAAWSPIASPTDTEEDKRSVKYNIISGTSMACPHATGVAAYVKTFHPNWSPSMIKSALMTTAYPLNATANPDAEFAYGAGHIDPLRAINPGLVYDTEEKDYIMMLCSMFTPDVVAIILGDKNTTCPAKKLSPKDINYPSMTSSTRESITSSTRNTNFTRTVTNVGRANSTYHAIIHSPVNLKVTVYPTVLSFKNLNEKKSFTVVVSLKPGPNKSFNSASLVWSDGIHSVRSPIVVYVYGSTPCC